MRRILQNDVGLLPYQDMFFTRLEYGKLQPVFQGKKLTKAFYDKKEHSQLVVTGIASPKLLIRHLHSVSEKMETLVFPDHHAYSKEDIQNIQNKFDAIKAEKKIVVTTEKDAMRFKDIAGLSEQLKDAMYFMPVKVRFLEEEKRTFNKKILNYVGENKSNRELHKRKNSGKP